MLTSSIIDWISSRDLAGARRSQGMVLLVADSNRVRLLWLNFFWFDCLGGTVRLCTRKLKRSLAFLTKFRNLTFCLDKLFRTGSERLGV